MKCPIRRLRVEFRENDLNENHEISPACLLGIIVPTIRRIWRHQLHPLGIYRSSKNDRKCRLLYGFRSNFSSAVLPAPPNGGLLVFKHNIRLHSMDPFFNILFNKNDRQLVVWSHITRVPNTANLNEGGNQMLSLRLKCNSNNCTILSYVCSYHVRYFVTLK